MWMLVSCACKREFHKYDITHVYVVPRFEIVECVCERDTWKGLLPTVTEIREEREGLRACVHGSDKVWRRDREKKESAHERKR